MLVKAQTFTIKSHHPTATARQRYLQKDGREVAIGTRNIVDEAKWAREMDRTRDQYHLRGTVVGREYVLSPSPDDNATPAQMLKFGLEFAERNFPNCEAVVIVHEDSKERIESGKTPIVHAHVYVSAVDLEKGKKVQIKNAEVRRIHDVAQEMSEQRGWSTQERYWDDENKRIRHVKTKRSEYERRPKWQRLEERRNPEYEQSSLKGKVSRYEYEAQRSGRMLDKTYVRRALKESVSEVASTPGKTIAQAMWERGVVVTKAADGELKYRRDGSTREFRGSTLGDQYGKDRLEQQIEEQRKKALVKGEACSRSNGLHF